MTQTAARTVRFLLRHPGQSQGFRELLDDDLALTMLWIPPGRFWMGSPEDEPERSDDEGPQHLVQLEGFFMAQTPITQAQWRVVASWPQSWNGRGLSLNPSSFQGTKARLLAGEANTNDRPVENTSWFDAMEFCSRLSQRTGRTYTLPSEAQWEYACRAGSTTPFAFGATITPELANYNGSYAYGNGPKGEYREQTTPVGMFSANAWGLKDMHGNVGEWCHDHWHSGYQGAPSDGSSWCDSEAGYLSTRVQHGGSFASKHVQTRSSARVGERPEASEVEEAQARNSFWSGFSPWRGNTKGFRVVCLPQGRSSTAARKPGG